MKSALSELISNGTSQPPCQFATGIGGAGSCVDLFSRSTTAIGHIPDAQIFSPDARIVPIADSQDFGNRPFVATV